MRQFLKELQAPFSRFIRGRSHFLMLLQCQAEDCALLLKSLEGLENDPENADIFIKLGHSFRDSFSWVDQVLALVRLQFDQVNLELEKRGEPKLPQVPDRISLNALKPEDVLRETVAHVREVVPPDRKVVWLFTPLEIADGDGCLELVQSLRQGAEAWTESGVRVIFRDDAGNPFLSPSLSREPEVMVHRPRLDPDTVEEKLAQQANDPRVSPGEQAQLHMMLAGMDVSKGRHDLALARNKELLGYFTHTGQRHQQSVVLNNLGDLHYLQGRYREAQRWYERAIGLSVQLASAPMVLYQSMNLGHTLFMRGRFEDSLLYYRAAEQLAQASSSPIQRIEALERIGGVQREGKAMADASRTWEQALRLSRQFQYDAGVRSNLENLHRLYGETGDFERRRECARQLSDLNSGGPP